MIKFTKLENTINGYSYNSTTFSMKSHIVIGQELSRDFICGKNINTQFSSTFSHVNCYSVEF